MKFRLNTTFAAIAVVVVGTILSAPSADEKNAAQELLQKCIAEQGKLRSLRGTVLINRAGRGGRVEGRANLLLQKPNRGRFEVKTDKGSLAVLILTGDGKLTAYFNDGQSGRYATERTDGSGMPFATMLTPIGGGVEAAFFVDPKTAAAILLGSAPKLAGTKKVGATECRVLTGKNGVGTTFEIYVGPDNLIRGASVGSGSDAIRTQLLNFEKNPKLAEKAFTWTPPKKAKAISFDELTNSAKASPTPKPGAKLPPKESKLKPKA